MRNLLIFGISGAVVAFLIFNRSKEQQAADEMLGFTEETGLLGDLGAVTNRASGGIFADLGSAIGEFFSGSFFDRRTLDDF